MHKELIKKYKNLLTIIIPRHIERVDKIKVELENINLHVHIHEPKNRIEKNTDIYIVNSYGKTKSFYSMCENVFLGGSLINHGGQNPLEAARYGCNILHGPNISNFKEIYEFLKKNNISTKILKRNHIVKNLGKIFTKKKRSQNIKEKLDLIGQKILDSTYKEIKPIL